MRRKETNGNVTKRDTSNGIKRRKPIRRSKMNLRITKEIRIVYSNIQGFMGKKSV